MVITITAIFKCDPEFLVQLKNLFEPLVAATRKEEACIQYDLHQSNEDENIFIMMEQWADDQGFDQHLKTNHFITFAEQVPPLLTAPLQIIKSVKII